MMKIKNSNLKMQNDNVKCKMAKIIFSFEL